MPALTAATLDIGANGQYKATQATITADKPAWNSSATWNTGAVAFTHLKANVTDTASAAGSLLADLQVGGVSKFSVSKAGAVVAAAGVTATTGTFSGAVSMAALTATTGTFSSTLAVLVDGLIVDATKRVLVGTTVTAGVSAGDLVIANNRGLRGVTASGTGTQALIFADSNNVVQVGQGAAADCGPAVPSIAAASHGANTTNRAGALSVDATNTSRFVYYDAAGVKRYLIGTTF